RAAPAFARRGTDRVGGGGISPLGRARRPVAVGGGAGEFARRVRSRSRRRHAREDPVDALGTLASRAGAPRGPVGLAAAPGPSRRVASPAGGAGRGRGGEKGHALRGGCAAALVPG